MQECFEKSGNWPQYSPRGAEKNFVRVEEEDGQKDPKEKRLITKFLPFV